MPEKKPALAARRWTTEQATLLEACLVGWSQAENDAGIRAQTIDQAREAIGHAQAWKYWNDLAQRRLATIARHLGGAIVPAEPRAPRWSTWPRA